MGPSPHAAVLLVSAEGMVTSVLWESHEPLPSLLLAESQFYKGSPGLPGRVGGSLSGSDTKGPWVLAFKSCESLSEPVCPRRPALSLNACQVLKARERLEKDDPKRGRSWRVVSVTGAHRSVALASRTGQHGVSCSLSLSVLGNIFLESSLWTLRPVFSVHSGKDRHPRVVLSPDTHILESQMSPGLRQAGSLIAVPASRHCLV